MMSDVYMDQNHLEHIKKIDEFLQSPYAAQITPMGLQILMGHRQKHAAFLYGMTETNLPSVIDDKAPTIPSAQMAPLQ
jgi:hypothetical protein